MTAGSSRHNGVSMLVQLFASVRLTHMGRVQRSGSTAGGNPRRVRCRGSLPDRSLSHGIDMSVKYETPMHPLSLINSQGRDQQSILPRLPTVSSFDIITALIRVATLRDQHAVQRSLRIDVYSRLYQCGDRYTHDDRVVNGP